MTLQDLIHEVEGNPFNDILSWMLVEQLVTDKGMTHTEALNHLRHLQEVAVKSSELFTAHAVLRTTTKDRHLAVAQVLKIAGAPSPEVPLLLLSEPGEPTYHRAVPPAALTPFGVPEAVTVGACEFLGVYEAVIAQTTLSSRSKRTKRVNQRLRGDGT